MGITKLLTERKLITPPDFLDPEFEARMGSHAYGTAIEVSAGSVNSVSDCDVYGFCIPPKKFAHSFEEFKQLNVCFDDSANNGGIREYDIKIYSVIKFFQRCTDNGPMALELLFAPEENILLLSPIAKLVRDARYLFLSKQARFQFGEFARVQLDDLINRRLVDGKRKQYIDKYGYDVKAAYHIVRLMNEAEQILAEGDLDLQRSRQQLMEIRSGEWKEEQVVRYFQRKDKELDALYRTSKLQQTADDVEINKLLATCLEMHSGQR